MSNATVLVHEKDDAPYRLCYLDLTLLPRIGDKFSVVPHDTPIEHYVVIDVTHAVNVKWGDNHMLRYDPITTIHVKEPEEKHQWRQEY